MTTYKTTPVAEFSIHHTQFIDPNGQATQPLPDFATQEKLTTLYQSMLTLRTFDKKTINLQRTGKMGTYPSCRGSEALSIGIGDTILPEDVFCPYYRDQGVLFQRQGSLLSILQYWGGNEKGSLAQHDKDLPVCVPIASQCLHAAGIAFSFQYRQEARVAVCTLGEGGTSEGDFYEAINLAGAWNLPVVFIVNNNQWAISVPLSEQTRCQTIAQKAIAAGIPSLQVDGNDVVAVKCATELAIDTARAGQGPTLIEALSYRLCDHTTADDASRYQSQEHRQAAEKNEPLLRLRTFLSNTYGLTQSDYDEFQANSDAVINDAVEKYLQQTPCPPTAAFDHLFEELPDAYIEQYDAIGAQS
ncbi:MAG: pyruvate dehydrogenase (acetyl-transferring) E1 component subunit alpha [Legionellales bacterium]|nr:pyruvate dehydrogenase (acetyl-transferring) E1 component subunit alpha [Legionellales bacterium]HAG61718.1 pyruvate dehydrogenase (acetyl-transferring) E1 component subunit alpha [Coxiellaceae bacterium]|tara:strand:+ start:212 stop:1285 length:1074 start_codon:yes stop_codon:yes gene_type:complete